MKTKRAPKPVNWDQSALAPFRAGLSSARLKRDEEALSALFNEAARVPKLKEALDWAHDHGIEFIVDRTCKAGGYYNVGTGVVAIAGATLKDRAYAVGALVHEIRHAWQDYYGMIPTGGTSFTGYFIRLAAVEADATSQETVASKQYTQAQWQEHLKRQRGLGRPDALAEKRTEHALQQIAGHYEQWAAFRGWYTRRGNYYGDTALKHFGKSLGIPGVQPRDGKFEFMPYDGKPMPKIEGLDVERPEQLRRLGKSFTGGNYFNAARADNFHLQDILSPRLAADFFKAQGQGAQVRALAKEVRRRELRLKRHLGRAVMI